MPSFKNFTSHRTQTREARQVGSLVSLRWSHTELQCRDWGEECCTVEGALAMDGVLLGNARDPDPILSMEKGREQGKFSRAQQPLSSYHCDDCTADLRNWPQNDILGYLYIDVTLVFHV